MTHGSVRLDGGDVTAEIRGPEVTAGVSDGLGASGGARALACPPAAWAEQRGGGVVEGRDIGTVVFPDAPVKVFLTADEDERARRRQRDEEAAGPTCRPGGGARRVDRRDTLDSDRTYRRSRRRDAVVIDTTGRGVDDVVDEIVERYESTVRPVEPDR